jgi:hypothetical protein
MPVLQQMWREQSYLLLDNPTLKTIKLTDSKAIGRTEGFTLVSPLTD